MQKSQDIKTEHPHFCEVCWEKTLPAYPSCPSSHEHRVFPEKEERNQKLAQLLQPSDKHCTTWQAWKVRIMQNSAARFVSTTNPAWCWFLTNVSFSSHFQHEGSHKECRNLVGTLKCVSGFFYINKYFSRGRWHCFQGKDKLFWVTKWPLGTLNGKSLFLLEYMLDIFDFKPRLDETRLVNLSPPRES